MEIFFKLWIKDKQTREIIGLTKKEDLAIEWDGKWGGQGGAKGEIIFEKSGKKYLIKVVILLQKYLWGMRERVGEWKFFVPLNAPYEIYQGYMDEPNNSPEKDRERQEVVELTNQWRTGRIAFFLSIIVAVFVLLIYIIKIKKRKIIKKGV